MVDDRRRRAGIHRLRRRPDHLLGAAGQLPRQQDHARGRGYPDRGILPQVGRPVRPRFFAQERQELSSSCVRACDGAPGAIDEDRAMAAENPTKNGPQTVSLADEESVKQILVSTVLGLWDIVNNLTRLRPSKQERYRVTIFGSARAQPGSYV